LRPGGGDGLMRPDVDLGSRSTPTVRGEVGPGSPRGRWCPGRCRLGRHPETGRSGRPFLLADTRRGGPPRRRRHPERRHPALRHPARRHPAPAAPGATWVSRCQGPSVCVGLARAPLIGGGVSGRCPPPPQGRDRDPDAGTGHPEKRALPGILRMFVKAQSASFIHRKCCTQASCSQGPIESVGPWTLYQ